MQTLSLEEVIEKMDGIPFCIDFYQDFSSIFTENPNEKMCISEIVEYIMNPPVVTPVQSYHGSLEERKRSIEFWEEHEKMMKKERKAEEKWRKKHKKISGKQAYKNLKRVRKEIMRG